MFPEPPHTSLPPRARSHRSRRSVGTMAADGTPPPGPPCTLGATTRRLRRGSTECRSAPSSRPPRPCSTCPRWPWQAWATSKCPAHTPVVVAAAAARRQPTAAVLTAVGRRCEALWADASALQQPRRAPVAVASAQRAASAQQNTTLFSAAGSLSWCTAGRPERARAPTRCGGSSLRAKKALSSHWRRWRQQASGGAAPQHAQRLRVVDVVADAAYRGCGRVIVHAAPCTAGLAAPQPARGLGDNGAGVDTQLGGPRRRVAVDGEPDLLHQPRQRQKHAHRTRLQRGLGVRACVEGAGGAVAIVSLWSRLRSSFMDDEALA